MILKVMLLKKIRESKQTFNVLQMILHDYVVNTNILKDNKITYSELLKVSILIKYFIVITEWVQLDFICLTP